jgi:hypothetical protein
MPQVLATSEKLLGPQHPETLTAANDLAILVKTMGRYDESAELFKVVSPVFVSVS